MGGSSAINAMLYIRGHPQDYDEWRDLGCPGWGWDDVLPVFKRAEHNVRGADDYHGGDGPLWVSDQRDALAVIHASTVARSPRRQTRPPGLFQALIGMRKGEIVFDGLPSQLSDSLARELYGAGEGVTEEDVALDFKASQADSPLTTPMARTGTDK